MTELQVMPSPVPVEVTRPLCVDLDGTLVKSDTLVDSLLTVARQNPAALLQAPSWISHGKAYLKARVTSLAVLDVVHLPYNRPLLNYLREEHAAGRKLYLATGADQRLAERIAAHLGIFEAVMASDGAVNLTGEHKLQQLQGHFANFDYVGNAVPDLPLLQAAKEGMLANPAWQLRSALKHRHIPVRRSFEDRPARLVSLQRALRVHQWAKNLLVFLPLLLAHRFSPASFLIATAAFFCFCFTASATYILNDLLDLQTDRLHLSKRKRPFAAGDVSAVTGLGISFVLLAAALGTALTLPTSFVLYLALYLVTTLLYSLALKRIVLVDVILLSSLYTIRMIAGSAATHTPVSPWLAAFSVFLFLSLAMVKRFSELRNLQERGVHPSNGRGYLLADIEQMRSFGTSSAYSSIVIFALYISGHDVVALYHRPNRMWLITPLLILWVSRVWLLASRGELDEDPVVFALTDRMSLLLGLGVVLIAWSAL